MKELPTITMIRQTIALTERKQTQSKQSNKQKLWWKTSIVSRCLTATNLLLQRSIGCCGSIIKCLSFDGTSIVWQYHERSMIIVKGWLKFEAIIAILQQPDRKIFVRNRSRFIQTSCAGVAQYDRIFIYHFEAKVSDGRGS